MSTPPKAAVAWSNQRFKHRWNEWLNDDKIQVAKIVLEKLAAGSQRALVARRIEKGRRTLPGALPGSKLLAFENAPSAPVLLDLHWRVKRANQNCCSIGGTKMLLRREHTES